MRIHTSYCSLDPLWLLVLTISSLTFFYFLNDDNIMYSNPISTSIKLNKTLKKQRKDGTVLKYNCPYCIY